MAQKGLDRLSDDVAAADRGAVATTETTLAETLRHELEGAIFRGELVPGEKLDEQDIGRRYGVSRTPVREALQSLASSGLVEIRPRQGAIVAVLTVTKLVEMFQVMAELEGLCARLAARRMSPEGRKELVRTHEEMIESLEGSDDPLAFYEANKRFHEAIYEGSHNAFLIGETRALRARVAPYRRYVTFQPGRMQASVGEHAAVVDAILDRREDDAHTQMREHVNLLGDGLADFIAALPSNLLRTG